MKRLFLILAAVVSTVLPSVAPAQAPRPTVHVEQAWARASAGPAKNGVAYVTLRNAGTVADRLIAGSSPRAAKVEFHTHIDEGGVLRMRAVAAVDVKPGEPVTFKPGGLHVMLVDLTAPLREGERFPLTLIFERAGPVTVEVAVQKPGAKGPAHDHGHPAGHSR